MSSSLQCLHVWYIFFPSLIHFNFFLSSFFRSLVTMCLSIVLVYFPAWNLLGFFYLNLWKFLFLSYLINLNIYFFTFISFFSSLCVFFFFFEIFIYFYFGLDNLNQSVFRFVHTFICCLQYVNKYIQHYSPSNIFLFSSKCFIGSF